MTKKFPDLSGDGKVTKKDMRKGMTFKKSHNKAMRKVGA